MSISIPGLGVGVDLGARHKDVRRLILSFLRFKGQDLEDLIQDVYLLILVRNGGLGAHDPQKSSFSNYVWMTLRTVATQRASFGNALKRGGRGTGTLEHEPVTQEPAWFLDSVASPWASDDSMRALYLRELKARKTCPDDVAAYLELLTVTTDSETLQEAMDLETAQMRALRRRLIWWLRQEGELSDESMRPGSPISD